MQAQAKRAQDLENGAEVGARSPDSALYRLSRDSPVSRATCHALGARDIAERLGNQRRIAFGDACVR